MENTIVILAEIIYACVITLKSTNKERVKLFLKDAVKQVKDGEEVMSQEVFLFPSQLKAAFYANTSIDIDNVSTENLAHALRGAKVLLKGRLTEDEAYLNFTIGEMLLQDNGLDKLEEYSIRAELDAKSRERRIERQTAKDKADTKKAMSDIADKFAVLEALAEATEATPAPAPEEPVVEVTAEAIAEAEAKLAAAEAACAADPTPAKKGAVTRAKKALAKLQA